MIACRSLCLVFAAAFALPAAAFDSGSTGANGALNPNVDTEVELPADGVLHYSSINIPSGVTVRFRRNALNTPVTLLVSGDATIAGVLDVNGQDAADANGAGNGNVGDDGLPGLGGPGGFPGGAGAAANANSTARVAQSGLGPGGGRPSSRPTEPYRNGTGGSFGTVGEVYGGATGPTYGNVDLLPLVGGSGGSGGNSWTGQGGSGGGGGGGALLLAVSGTLNVTGTIRANGGRGGDIGNTHNTGPQPGGGGSGGGIRLIASTFTGNGAITATGGREGRFSNHNPNSAGGLGRIRIEAEVLSRTAGTNPAYTQSTPGPVVIAGVPSLRIASVAGIAAPAAPTGGADIVLPEDALDPLEVIIETTNVPLGNTVSIIVTPPSGNPQTVISNAIQGSEASGSARANVSFGDGLSVLLATLSYSVSGPQGKALARYTEGEPVVQVALEAGLGGLPRTVLVTESGRRVELPAGIM
ncbi:hypothetical protein [Pseudomarimonas arenosa]|uniref:PE-PGRS family protein n=1 Tax=Pseudomarimonas arenosa TaxID=2774145 RepID=A0AAW3ZJW1_9GAMM|nr:hypothetical protein [Pseudomarimonas arenosa]MBD8525504.1 hypothetical protein [Pseudomarimonas arenosa]